MSSNVYPFYKHSGKFGVHGPILAAIAGLVVAFPLGILYAYLIEWIPFIYLNILITLGYGFAFGAITGFAMKYAKVRNGMVALLSGLVVGLMAWWGNWNGCAHALVAGDAPWLFGFDELKEFIGVLYENGSWSIKSSTVSGVPLAIVWLVEGAIIVGMAAYFSYTAIARMPFCEHHQCWLNLEKTIDALAAFERPEQLAAFSAGDVSPLEAPQPREHGSGKSARVVLKYADRCHDFFTLSVVNVTLTVDKKGKKNETEKELMTNLKLPKPLFDQMCRLEGLAAKQWETTAA